MVFSHRFGAPKLTKLAFNLPHGLANIDLPIPKDDPSQFSRSSKSSILVQIPLKLDQRCLGNIYDEFVKA